MRAGFAAASIASMSCTMSRLTSRFTCRNDMGLTRSPSITSTGSPDLRFLSTEAWTSLGIGAWRSSTYTARSPSDRTSTSPSIPQSAMRPTASTTSGRAMRASSSSGTAHRSWLPGR